MRFMAIAIPLIATGAIASSGAIYDSHGGGGLLSTDIDTSAELATILTDETGSGAACFATAPTFTTSIATPVMKSTNADPADAGAIRLGNAECIEWEANPTGTDLTECLNTSNVFAFSAPVSATTLTATAVGSVLASTTTTPLAIYDPAGTARSDVVIDSYSNTGSIIFLRGGAGSRSSGQLTANGNSLGQLQFMGNTTNSGAPTYGTGARVYATAAENWTSSANGTNLFFGTTTKLNVFSTDRWEINDAGNFIAVSDNAYDIGISNGSRPKNIYAVGVISTVGTITDTSTTNIGWSVVAGANTACNTTCTNACVFGFDTALGGSDLVDCADATADRCVCAGAN